MLPVGAFVNATSTGHGNCVTAGETARTIAGPDVLSETVDPNGIAPGCHVTVACPSVVTTAPASAGCATAAPTTAAGTGAAATGAVVVAVADVEPPLPVAVTTSEIVAPMSPGVSVYVEVVAAAGGEAGSGRPGAAAAAPTAAGPGGAGAAAPGIVCGVALSTGACPTSSVTGR